jgi:hypothetical protein
MTVTNTGTVLDTYNLAAGGPAGLVATLGMTQVTLAPGVSQVVPITTGSINFADPGNLNLTAVATSQGNPAVQAAATATIQVPTTQALGAEFDPATQMLPGPGTTSFLLLVHNTGNTEDAYTATITGTSGRLTASLNGLDGQATQTIHIFRLPGLFTGGIVLQVNVTGLGPGAVTVQVSSLSNGGINASVTATVTTALQTPTVTVSDAGGTYNGSPFAASATATGVAVDGTLASSPDSKLTFTYYTGSSVSGAGSPIAPTNAGTYTVVAHFAGGGNYASADSAPATFSISPATPSVQVTAHGGTYNGNSSAASATATGVTGDGTLATSPSSALSFTYYTGSSAGGTGSPIAPTNAGTYTVVAHFAGGGNYTSADSAAITFSIAKATPKVTVIGGTFTYNGQPHPATGSVVGVNGADLGVPTFTYTDSSGANVAVPVNAGTYQVVATFPGNSNYAAASNTAVIVIASSTFATPLTMGFWKNHPKAWPVTTLTLGGYSYNQTELLAILNTTATDNARIILAQQLIAAKLNLANGSNPAPIQGTIITADGLLAGLGKITANSPKVKVSSALGQQMVQTAAVLTAYNEDLL